MSEIYIMPNEATHATVLTIEFSDGGESELSPLFYGSFDDCDKLAREMPAASYSGMRPVLRGSIGVFPLFVLCAQCNQRHEGECAVSK